MSWPRISPAAMSAAMSAAWMRRAWPGKSMSMVQAHDAAVAGLSTVEAKEVFAVQGEQDAIFATGVAKDFVIRPSLSGASGFQNGGDIAAESPEFLDDGQREVFVGAEPQHTRSVRFVFGDGACDFRAMGAVVGPGVGEVFGVERGIAAEKIGFAEASSRARASVQTGMRVRLMQASPPQTAGSLSTPGKLWPRSRATICSRAAFSPGVMAGRSASASARSGIGIRCGK